MTFTNLNIDLIYKLITRWNFNVSAILNKFKSTPMRSVNLYFYNIIVLNIFMLHLVGCSKDLEESVVGKWSIGDDSIELFSDGDVILETDEKRLSGEWILVDGNRLKMTFTILGTESIVIFDNIKIEGDIMNLSMDGEPDTATRQKK